MKIFKKKKKTGEKMQRTTRAKNPAQWHFIKDASENETAFGHLD